MCRSDRRGQPVIELDQPPNLERRGLLDLARVQGLDAFEHLAHQRRSGRVDKAVVAVPEAMAARRWRRVLVAKVCA